jgi:SAM-dependent methyltransferase
MDASRIKSVRRALRPVRRALREFRHRVLRRAGLIGGDWDKGLPEELRFWKEALREEGRHWDCSEYQARMDPQLELQAELKRLIPAPAGAVVRLLDVGAGPLTRLGKRWEGRTLQLYPLDPLAEEYKALLARLELRPPVLTETGHGERLTEKFEKNFFDLAYASNSLDHSYDPLLAIRQMFAVVKPQCSVYLWHFAAVGTAEGYQGLHQWNFGIRGGDMILSDGRSKRFRLGDEFRGMGELECEYQKFGEVKVVVGKLKKLVAS